jgi:hypothetical protein
MATGGRKFLRLTWLRTPVWSQGAAATRRGVIPAVSFRLARSSRWAASDDSFVAS